MPLSSLQPQTQEGIGSLSQALESRRTLSLLVVTREHADEKRYGLGRSIAPLLAELAERRIRHRYLCQADLDEAARAAIGRWQGRLARMAAPLFSKTDWVPLLQAALERLAMGRLAARIAARDHYDLVHCHDPLIAAGLRLAGPARLRRRYAWGVTLHGFGSFFEALRAHGIRLGPWLAPALRRLEAFTLNSADWVIAPTRLGLAELSRHLGIADVPSTWHAVPHPRPAVKVRDRREARAALGWAEEEIYIVAVGRHDPVKDFLRLVEACAGLRTPCPLHVAILGEGDYAGFRSRAAAAGFTHDLILTVTDDIGLILSAADIYASMSITESFGIANLEALTAGVPAVCTAVGGVPEVVGDAAVLVPPGDTGAMRRALQRLLEDGEQRTRLAARGRRRAAAWPDVSQTAVAYEQIYRLAVAQKAG